MTRAKKYIRELWDNENVYTALLDEYIKALPLSYYDFIKSMDIGLLNYRGHSYFITNEHKLTFARLKYGF